MAPVLISVPNRHSRRLGAAGGTVDLRRIHPSLRDALSSVTGEQAAMRPARPWVALAPVGIPTVAADNAWLAVVDRPTEAPRLAVAALPPAARPVTPNAPPAAAKAIPGVCAA